MLIIGAKGFAKEVLEICHQNKADENLSFYDDVNKELTGKLFDLFPILKSEEEARNYFDTVDKNFTIGIGNPSLRKRMDDKFTLIGGKLQSSISPKSMIGSYDINIANGVNILDGVCVSNSVSIGKGTMIYYNAIITHDCTIGEFVEISPGVKILGRVSVGNYCQIGAGAIILPDKKIGNNVIVGAGCVVTKDVPDNSLIVGVPGKVVKELKPLEF